MFTGIIEQTGEVTELKQEQGNLHITLRVNFIDELKIDQSVAHNGVCLTIVDIQRDTYTVTAIAETLSKTNLGDLSTGSLVNIERCMKVGDRLDGHFVQGHVDQTAVCSDVKEMDGSWLFTFEYEEKQPGLIVEKGSVCVNGVSLTVVNPSPGHFSVAIIPYTFEHTNFCRIKKGNKVNLEFDVLGKYIAQLMQVRQAI